MKWTALTGVTPGRIGWSVKGSDTDTSTVTVNDCTALKPPGSVAVTRIVPAPSRTSATITKAPVTLAVTTCVADDDAVNDSASPSGSTNATDTGTARANQVRRVRVEMKPHLLSERVLETLPPEQRAEKRAQP